MLPSDGTCRFLLNSVLLQKRKCYGSVERGGTGVRGERGGLVVGGTHGTTKPPLEL